MVGGQRATPPRPPRPPWKSALHAATTSMCWSKIYPSFKKPSLSASTLWLAWICWVRARLKSTMLRAQIFFGSVPLLSNTLPLRLQAGLPIVEAEVNHLSAHLMVDTGASSLVLFEPSSPRPVRVSEVRPTPDTIGEFERKQVWLPSLRLGEAEFGKEPAFLVRSRSDGSPGLRRIDESGRAGHHQSGNRSRTGTAHLQPLNLCSRSALCLTFNEVWRLSQHPGSTFRALPARICWILSSGCPVNRSHGFFGPGSVTWQVNRESAVFLGAGRAALLQLAHPWVAGALAQHSNLLNDAVGRFHSTFRVIYTMLFGTRGTGDARPRSNSIGSTRAIRGELPSGEHYEANEVAALRWVYATLVESAVMAYEFVLPPLTLSDRGQYYAESKRMAALFGISAEALPKDWTGFLQYTANMFDSPQLCVDAGALALGPQCAVGRGHVDTATALVPRADRLLDAAATPHGLCTAISVRAKKKPYIGPRAGYPGSILTIPGHVALRRPLSRSQRPPARSRARRLTRKKQLLLDGPAQIAISGISE